MSLPDDDKRFTQSDLRISAEEPVERRRLHVEINNLKLSHWTALGIVTAVTIACLVGLFVFPSGSSQSDTASKLLFLIVGGIIGFLYGNQGPKK